MKTGENRYMTAHNQRVKEALNRYIGIGEENPPAPHYAIMLNGEWGCGKTYFVKEKWLNDIPRKEKDKLSITYISLFGLKSVEELKEEIAHTKIIFEDYVEKSIKANELLEKGKDLAVSNFVKGFGGLFSKFLENKIGLGFEDFSKMFIRDWLSENKEGITKVLILDDLERSKMDLKEIFGFVSSYLESTGLRVIFISNDCEINKTEIVKMEEKIATEEVNYKDVKDKKEIDEYLKSKEKGEIGKTVDKVVKNFKTVETIKTQNSDDDYKRIREKVIGETLKIEPNIDEAITHFFNEMSYKEDEKQLVDRLVRAARTIFGYNNLRVIRQTLMKLLPLLRLVTSVDDYNNYKHQFIEINGKKYPKEYYIEIVCKFFIIAHIQKVMGDLNVNDLGLSLSLQDFIMYQPLTQSDGEQGLILWANYIWNGELNVEDIKKAVQKDMDTLAPLDIVEKDTIFKLQVGYWDYSKDEFYKLQSKLIEELKQGVYTDIRAITQAYALLVTFENDEILEGIDNIDDLFEQILSDISITYLDADKAGYRGDIEYLDIGFGGYRGYSIYSSADKPRVEAFQKKLKVKYRDDREIIRSQSIQQLVNEILEGSKDANHLFDSLESKQPILEWIGSDKLWEVLDKTSLMYQRDLLSKLKSRYGLNSTGAESSYLVFKKELKILESLVAGYIERYEKARKEKDNKVSIYNYLIVDAERTLEGFKAKMEKGEAEMKSK